MLSGMEKATTVFNDESYITTTSIGKTEFPYDRNIDVLAETSDYFAMKSPQRRAQQSTPAVFRYAGGSERAVCQTGAADGSGSQPRAWSRFKYALILCSRWKPS